MMRILEYKSVTAISGKELDNAVNRQIKLGFQPLGSPYVVGTGSSQSIYQAMVKFEGLEAPDLQPKPEEELKVG
jgi:hypothetical protein